MAEPGTDGTLAGMTKRRVADIVGKAGGLHNIAKVSGVNLGRQQALLRQPLSHLNAECATNAGYFQRMGQAVMHMIIGGQRVYLSFPGQTPEGSGKNNLVMVAQKSSAPGFILGATLTQPTFVEKCCPVHLFSVFRKR